MEEQNQSHGCACAEADDARDISRAGRNGTRDRPGEHAEQAAVEDRHRGQGEFHQRERCCGARCSVREGSVVGRHRERGADQQAADDRRGAAHPAGGVRVADCRPGDVHRPGRGDRADGGVETRHGRREEAGERQPPHTGGKLVQGEERQHAIGVSEFVGRGCDRVRVRDGRAQHQEERRDGEVEKCRCGQRPASGGAAARPEQSLHHVVIGRVGGECQEEAARDPDPERPCARDREEGLEVEDASAIGCLGPLEDRREAAVVCAAEDPQHGRSGGQEECRLECVGPHHCAQSAADRVRAGQEPKAHDRSLERPAGDGREGEGGDEETHSGSEDPRRCEARRRGTARPGAKALLEESIAGHDLEPIEERDDEHRHHELSNQRSKGELQVAPITRVRSRRNADEGGGGEFGCGERREHCPRREIASGQLEIGGGRAAPPDAKPDPQDRGRVDHYREGVEAIHGPRCPPSTGSCERARDCAWVGSRSSDRRVARPSEFSGLRRSVP